MRFAVLLIVVFTAVSCTGTIAAQPEAPETDEAPGGAPGTGGAGGSGPGTAVKSGARFARLTHFQWQNTVRDFLRFKQLPATGLTLQADAVIGFDNNNSGKALDVSFDLRSDYERAAETIAQTVVRDAAAVSRLLPANLPTSAEAKARAVISALGERAYRRPMEQSEVDELWALFKMGPSLVANTDPFNAGMELLISALLQSPFFLYRVEVGADGEHEGEFELTQFELATRLAFALTDTMPDDELLDAARGGRLETSQQIKDQAARLLKTPAAALSAAHFHEQLFRFASFEKTQKDPVAFPQFGSDMSSMLKEEARLFLDDIVQNDRPPAAILTSNETFVNSKLAAIYGLPGDFGTSFRKAQLDANRRQGLLSQIGFLAANAGAKDPDPIHRGVFISTVILCKVVPPPAAMVSPMPSKAKTNRERVDGQTGEGTCGAACHARLINPLGFAFESFDAIGQYRTMDNESPVNTSAEYDGLDEGTIKVSGSVELTTKLSESADFHACYLGNWLQYLWSRSGHPEDAQALSALVEESLGGSSVRELLLSLVTAPSFRRYVP